MPSKQHLLRRPSVEKDDARPWVTRVRSEELRVNFEAGSSLKNNMLRSYEVGLGKIRKSCGHRARASPIERADLRLRWPHRIRFKVRECLSISRYNRTPLDTFALRDLHRLSGINGNPEYMPTLAVVGIGAGVGAVENRSAVLGESDVLDHEAAWRQQPRSAAGRWD
jgi:hypothetical protein